MRYMGRFVIARVMAIYFSPLDFPGLYVTRLWYVIEGVTYPVPEMCCDQFETIDLARDYVAQNWPEFRRLERSLRDDPCIVELYG